MYRTLITALIFILLAGCGHSQIQYQPSDRQLDWSKAVSVIEQGFYEDYGKQRTQAVAVTSEAIILSDGTISNSAGVGTAMPLGGSALILGSITTKTINAGQRIYLNSLGDSMLMKRNGRDHRYAVIIRIKPGSTARTVFFRSENQAKQFLDALEYLKKAYAAAN
ncbi:MAG: hypothetical protein RBR45_06640 [Pseudomonas sp.]|jgi:hypothetical protein|nr:hypothetical protein [Pseudomonas sp.]